MDRANTLSPVSHQLFTFAEIQCLSEAKRDATSVTDQAAGCPRSADGMQPHTCGVTMMTPARSSLAASPTSVAAMPVPAHGPHCTLKAGTPCTSDHTYISKHASWLGNRDESYYWLRGPDL